MISAAWAAALGALRYRINALRTRDGMACHTDS